MQKLDQQALSFPFVSCIFYAQKTFLKQNIKLVQMERLQANPMVHQVYTVFQ